MASGNIDYTAIIEYDTTNQIYDLTITTFSGIIEYTSLGFFILNRRHEGRLDLVSYDLFGDNKYEGSLCSLNSISNPYSIRNGDLLVYLPKEQMDTLSKVSEVIKKGENAINQAKQSLINSLKAKKPDSVRDKYLRDRGDDPLPSTILPDNSPQVMVDNNKILIAPNLYDQPTPEIVDPEDNTTQDNLKLEDSIERILVARYIKSVN